MLKHQETVLPIFVYGTLMVGERNYIDVLHKNLTHYEDAKVKGKLYYYKKEDYPALIKGENWIEGQLFYVNQLHDVLKPNLCHIQKSVQIGKALNTKRQL